MKGLCCNSGLLSHVGIEEAIDILAEEGYQGVEVSLELDPPFLPKTPPHMSPNDDAATRTRVRDHAKKAGVAIAALNAHTNLIAPTPEQRLTNLNFVKEAIQLAADLEAPYVIFCPGAKTYYGYEKTYWEWGVAAYRELLPEASRKGVQLTVEAASLPGCLVRNVETMQKFLSYDGLEDARIIFDSAHYHVRGDDVTQAFKALHEKVVHMHAKDARGNPEDFVFPPLGQGDIDLDSLIGEMIGAGYDGYFSLEYEAMAWGYPFESRQILREGKAFLEGILSKYSG